MSLPFPSNQPGKVCITLFFIRLAWQGVYRSLFPLACMAKSVPLAFSSYRHGKVCITLFFIWPPWQGVCHSLFHLACMARSVRVTLFFILLARKGVCHSFRFCKECTCHPLFHLACIARSVPLALYAYVYYIARSEPLAFPSSLHNKECVVRFFMWLAWN